MSLFCGDSDRDGAEWWYYYSDQQKPLNTKRARCCCSCGNKIKVGDQSLKFAREHAPINDIEERIYGDAVPMATWFMCEECGDLFENIKELGYTVSLTWGESMRSLCKALSTGSME